MSDSRERARPRGDRQPGEPGRSGSSPGPVAVGSHRRTRSRAERLRAERESRRRRTTRGILLSLCIGVVVAAVFLGSRMWHGFGPQNDFAGDGKQDLVIQVHPGDSTTAIGETLHKQDVVRTVKVFLEAAQGNQAISAIQPGYYRLRTELPAASAVKALADPGSRVGKLVIPEGEQLDDTSDVKTNATTPGIFTMIAKASCVELNGDKRCVTVNDLRTAAEKTLLASLSVPPWAVASATAMGDDHRRIEGLIGPGTWNVNPSSSPQEILESLISASAQQYVNSGSAGHRHRDEHVAVQHPGGRLAGAAGGQTAGLREGRSGHLQPAGRTPHAGVRLDGELSAGSPRGCHHRRRSRPEHAVEYLRRRRTARDADLFARQPTR